MKISTKLIIIGLVFFYFTFATRHLLLKRPSLTLNEGLFITLYQYKKQIKSELLIGRSVRFE